MKRKIFSMILLCGTAIAASGCNSGNTGLVPDNSGSEAVSSDTFVFDNEHLAKDTIHEGIDKVSYTSNVFISNATSSYRIVLDKNNDNVLKEALTLRGKVFDIFGFYLPIYDFTEVDSIDNTKNNIVYAINDFNDLMPTKEKIKSFGYTVKTVDNTIYALSYGVEGIKNANRMLLKVLIGFEPIYDLSVFEINGEPITKTSTLYLPNCSIVEVPDFEFRCEGQSATKEEKTAMGLSEFTDSYYRIGDGSAHNTLQLLPFAKYGPGHPNWYTSNGKQLCYTCHGDLNEYESLIKTLGDYCENTYLADNTNTNFFFGQMDKFGENIDADLCSCDTCMEIRGRYTDPAEPSKNYSSAVILNFFNDLSDYIRETYNNYDIRLVFFAYQDSMVAPYDPNNEIHARDNVSVMVAPSRASYTHSFYDPMQEDMENNYPKICEDWGKVTDSIYFYLYQTQFQSVLYPFQSFSSTIDNCRFMHECGGILIYPLGDVFNKGLTGFGKFKDYLYARGMDNVNSSYYKCKEFFFSHYYGAAGSIMENLYDQIVSYLTYLGSIDNGIKSGLITLPAYNNVQYWNKNILQQWSSMVDEALDVLEANRKSDVKNYELYKSHIEVEGVFPLFALCELFQAQFSATAFKEMATKLATWCRNNSVMYENETLSREGKNLETTRFKGWGV